MDSKIERSPGLKKARLGELRKSLLWIRFKAVAISLIFLTFLSPLFAADQVEQERASAASSVFSEQEGPGFTINFTNVSILEYIKFISKIANLNFVYDERELNFNVNILSEEPTSLVHVMSALVQVLKINGFGLIEQGNNLIITKSGKVSQIAPVVSQEFPLKKGHIPPIMTRVFKIKNANPSHVETILEPLLSADAILEVVADSRQIIVTDITQNIEEVEKLLLSIDKATSALSIDSYEAQHHSPKELIDLANQIIAPISEGNPVIFVPQIRTNTIFIVSTPHLVEKSLMIFEDLDTPHAVVRKMRGPLTEENILIYHPVNTPADLLQSAIKQLMSHLSKVGTPSQSLLETLSNMRYVRESHALLFTGESSTLKEVRNLLAQLDTPSPSGKLVFSTQDFYLYQVKQGNEEGLMRALTTLTNYLKKSPQPDQDLIKTLQSMKWMQESQSLIFTGDARSFERLKEILTTLSQSTDQLKGASGELEYFIYKLQNAPGSLVILELNQTAQSLKEHDADEKALLDAIANISWNKVSNSLVITGTFEAIEKLKLMIAKYDIQPLKESQSSQFYVYRPKRMSTLDYLETIQASSKTLEKGGLTDFPLIQTLQRAQMTPDESAVMFTGTAEVIKKVQELAPTFDTSPRGQATHLFVYKPLSMEAAQFQKSMVQTGVDLEKSGLKNASLIDAFKSATLSSDSASVLFTGTSEAIGRLETMVPKIDRKDEEHKTHKVFLFTPKHHSAVSIIKDANQTAEELSLSPRPNQALIEALKTGTAVGNSQSVMFTGTPEAMSRIKEIVPTFDYETSKASNFYLYKPVSVSPKTLQEHSIEAATKLEESGLDDPELLSALQSAKLDPSREGVTYVGTPEAIERLRQMIPDYDLKVKKGGASEFYVYHPQHMSADEFLKRMKETANSFENSTLHDPALLKALKSAQITSGGKAVLFTGTPKAIERIQKLCVKYDLHQESGDRASEFYVYQPEHMSANEFLQRMKETANNFENSTLYDPDLLKALRSAQITSGGKAVLFTGTPGSIEKIKELSVKYDHHQENLDQATQFFVYTPKHMSADELSQHLQVVADNMKHSGLVDTTLLNTLYKAKVVSNGKSILFTGTPSSIEGIKGLLPDIDRVKDGQESVEEKTTFFVYRVKNVPGPALMSHLRNIAADLERAGSKDTDLIRTIQNMRYIKETNSIIFTGQANILEQAKALAIKFDISELNTELSQRSPSGYLIYKPRHVSGQELISILRDFEQNLITSGIEDTPLFETIDHLKWMEQVSSILISGDENERTKVYNLLERFDIPSSKEGQENEEIEKIADMNFLVYKVQYHSGAKIQSALEKIGADINRASTSEASRGLIDAIKSAQWIEVTNSLIFTGQRDSLVKLEKFIKSIDSPLKQVFVEILVVETSISNSLDFGLRWGSQGVYKDRFAYATGSFPQVPSESPDPLARFNKTLSEGVGQSTPPSGSMIPFTSGFGLGVIGDVILHKGKSHFTLGSVINAIQGDAQSTVALSQKVITQDNKNATVFVGKNIPYTGSVVTNTSNNTITNSNLEYRDVGVSLSITPQVGDNETITLEIDEEITQDLSSLRSGSFANLSGIRTSKTSTQTSVTVPNKAFLIISGQIDNSLTKKRTSIPCLGGIPLIGAAFSQNDALSSKSCVIIFVRPQIISSFDVYKEITERQEGLHRSQTENIEAFDSGLELLKTPDDF